MVPSFLDAEEKMCLVQETGVILLLFCVCAPPLPSLVFSEKEHWFEAEERKAITLEVAVLARFAFAALEARAAFEAFAFASVFLGLWRRLTIVR